MTEQISKLLKDYLDELDDTMLREFKWYLGQHKERGSRPIQRSQLENTSRTETVDKLVQAYGAEGAVVTTVDVLYRMRLNDLATQLAQAIIDSDAEQREVGGAQPEAREQKPDEEQTLKAPKDLCCSICLSVFQTPVILQCGHSFCRTCVEKSWEGKVSRRCSLCDQLFTGAEPQVNFSLKNLSENYMESHSQPTPAPQLPPSSVPIPPKKIREKQEDFERLRNTCTSLVARIERQSRTTKTKINLLTLLQDSESSVASRTSTSADRRSQICGKPSVQSLEEAAENHKEHFRRTSSVSKATTEQKIADVARRFPGIFKGDKMEGLADLREKPCGDVGSTNRAEVHQFSPSLSAQGGSVLVAPSITGSSIGSLNITITSPDPGLISSKEALNNNNNGEVALQPPGQRFILPPEGTETSPQRGEEPFSFCPPDRTAECRQQLKAAIRRRFSHLLEGVTIDARKTPLRQIYTELYITEGGSGEVNKEHEVRQIEASPRVDARDKCISCNQLFAEGQDFQIRRVMTRGVAGVGKTVHVNKFTLDWAEDGEHDHLDFVFPLSFRELNLMREKRLSFEELLAVFFPETKESGIFKSVFSRILFILDGLDESRLSLDFENSEILADVTQEASVAVLLTNLIRGRLLPLALVWITSRPLASAQIPLEHLHLVTEVRGFNDPQKDEYFRRKIPEKPLAERVIAHVKSCRSLHIMCHLPIFCWMAATVLRSKLSTADGEDSPKTLTQMYIHFLSLYVDNVNKRLPDSSESKADVLRANLMSLGDLAYRQLEQGNLIFYEKDLVQSGIQVTQASVFSGVYTQIFSEEMILCREKMFCFIHLSIQEFFAALYVFLKFNSNNFNVLIRKPSPSRRFPFRDTSELVLYRAAVDKALQSEEGHFDIFLRFLLGLSLESNQTLLKHLMIQNRTQQRTRAEIIKHIKEKIRRSSSVDRCLNLFHCLNELNDRSLVDEIQSHLRSGHLHQSKLSSSQWNALVVVLLASEEDLGVFVLSQYARSEEGLLRLLPVVKAAQEAKLNACKLTVNCCEKLSNAISTSRLRELDLSNNPLADAGVAALSRGLINANLETLRLRSCSLTQDSSWPLASTISSGSCKLRLLDLSDNDLRDAGVQRLCGGLESPDCKLETLLLSLCGLTHQSCTFLASALNSSGLRELDLSYNHPGDAGLDLLSTLLHDPQCSLRVEHCGEARILPAPQKYTTKLTLDPNTAQVDLCLSEGNSTARRWTQQPYPDHLDRFDFWSQVLSVEGLTGRCYWETEWSQRVFIGAAYRSMRRKGEGDDSHLGKNESSWGVSCHPDGFRAWHKGLSSDLNGHPGSRKVGVFLDWCAGTLAFFTVADGALSLLHTFNTTFTEPVHAAFRLGWTNSTVHLC